MCLTSFFDYGVRKHFLQYFDKTPFFGSPLISVRIVYRNSLIRKFTLTLGAVHKTSVVRGEAVCPVRTREGVFTCGRPHFLAKKLRIFRNLWCVRMDKGGGG